MKFAFGLLELLIGVIIALVIFLFIPRNIEPIFPTREDVQTMNSNKAKIESQLQEIQQLKQEHDKYIIEDQ